MTYAIKTSFISVLLMIMLVLTFSSRTAVARDARTLLIPDHYGTYNPGGTPNCDEPFNSDLSNQLVPYGKEKILQKNGVRQVKLKIIIE